jgi:uncharacterized protein
MEKGFKGIAFPFRIGVKGGVATSTTSSTDFQHIKESIHQIILTYMGERIMEPGFGSEVLQALFEDFNTTTKNMIEFKLREAISRWEPRVSVLSLTVSQVQLPEGNTFIVSVDFSVLKYLVDDSVTIKLAG